MFSITLVTLDSYQSTPTPELDVIFSDFRGTEIKKVPVIRIFGSTPSGFKTCLHIHGVFPYMYVPCTIQKDVNSFMYRLATAIDSAINISLGSAMSNTQHVYRIQQVSGIPLYGYHEKEHLFFKVYFYNPAMIKRAADLLQNGAVLNQSMQPHEAHIPFILQFMIDYNLYGMSLINLEDVKYRQYAGGKSTENFQHESSSSLSDSEKYLPIHVARHSTCKVEVDAQASKILNGQEVLNGVDLNPGIAAIWNDEKHRREVKGLQQARSQLVFTNSNDRICAPTDTDIYQHKRLLQRLQAISQVNEDTTSLSSNTLSYPLEVGYENNSLNASHVLNHFKSSTLNRENEKDTISYNKLLNVDESQLKQTCPVDESIEASILDIEDMQLIDMLANLAEENEEEKFVDDDSMLGSQHSVLNNQNKEDNDDDEIEDLNITSLDLDSLSSWNSIPKTPSQSSEQATENIQEILKCTETASVDKNSLEEDISLTTFPQYDGSNDVFFNDDEKLSKKSNVNILQTTSMKYKFSFNKMLDKNAELYKILSGCYTSKYSAINTTLIFRNVNEYFNVHGKEAREFKSKRRKLIKFHKQELQSTCPRNILNLCILDHQDLDVYDVDKLINYENLKHTVHLNENCFNPIKYNQSYNGINKFLIELKVPAFDGNTVDYSDDSEIDQDVTIEREEKRICVYKSCTKSKNNKNIPIASPKKRKLEIEDEMGSPHKQRKLNSNCSQSEVNHTPIKSRKPQSPRLSGKYSPLNITVRSPKTNRNIDINEPSTSKLNTCVTPKRVIHQLRTNLLRERLGSSSLETEPDRLKQCKDNDIMKEKCDIKPNEKCITHKSNKEVCKRLSFLNTDNKETDFENNMDEHSFENLSPTEEIMDESHENNDDFENIHAMSFIQQGNVGESTKRNEELNSKPKDLESTLQKNDENFEISSENEEDTCNMTYTQFLNKKLELELNTPNSLSLESRSTITENRAIIITTRFKPPSRERIINTMRTYNIPECKSAAPFFSNKIDLIKHKEASNKNSNINDVTPFKSSLDRVTSITFWRRVKINEFYPSGSNIKSNDVKRVLAGYNSLVIQPLIQPPVPKNVRTWVQAKKYLLKKTNEKMKKSANVPTDLKDNSERKDHLLGSICEKTIIDSDNVKQTTSNGANSLESTKSLSQSSHHSKDSSESNDSLNPSLRKMLENSLLHKNNTTQKHLGVSYGQIEYTMPDYSCDVADENLQNARGLTMGQRLTLLSLEVHVATRGELLPDPEHDSIEAIFYAVYNDVPGAAHGEQIEHGAILANPSLCESKLKNIYSTSTACTTLFVANEDDLLKNLIRLIIQYDPDVIAGWEIESFSWGYILQRASRVGFSNFTWQISRVSNVTPNFKEQATDKDNLSDAKIPGRIVLDVWRIMRHETALLNYSFENVMYNVMRERISCPTFKTLTTWWKCRNLTIQWRVINHYVTRVIGTLRVLIQHDIIGRTCEHARLFGIQFYEVFSRGSQFRVESMMLRLAKPLNYIPISPSIQQRARMRAPESLPLIMEPQSTFYTDPLIVLDFQSLYPSMIIAYNYCFSTCLGRIEHIGQYEPFEFGAATVRVNKNTALKLQEKINYAPCGVAFVKPEVRHGILPRMLSEILNTRLMVKESMKIHGNKNRVLQRILHSQQLGLKLIANVTYGYTAANFSGRMPCIEVADSVVSKGRETLERAIKLVESTSKWGARVVYGDTDSLFILLPGKSRKDAFTIGAEIADAVTASNPVPVKLKFEKVLQPSILQTKKRYCGYMYESPDQIEPEYLAKGIETVRRDGCPAVSKILEKTLKILFDTKDVSLVKQYITRQFDKILRRKISIQDLTFAKEFRGLRGYKSSACVPALELTRRLMRKDPRAIPRNSERVRYVIVAGAPNQPLIHCVRTPMEVMLDEGLNPNSLYYITKVLIPPLNRCLNLVGIDVNTWYREMCHRQTPDKAVSLFTENQKVTIRQFFSSIACAACGGQTQKDICENCMADPSQTVTVLQENVKCLERTHYQLTMICQSCTGYLDEPKCESLDCPVLYRLVQAKRDLIQIPYLNKIIYDN